MPVLRPARRIGGRARARARARAEDSHQRGRTRGSSRRITRASRPSRSRDYPYIVAISLAELGRSQDVLPVLLELEHKLPGRLRDFAVVARTLLEGHAAESIAAVGRIVGSDFRDPEGLFYLSRHLARLNEVGPALDLLERVVASGYFCFPAMARDPWLDSLRKKPAFTTTAAAGGGPASGGSGRCSSGLAAVKCSVLRRCPPEGDA